MECFKCEEKGHKYRECLEQRKMKEEKRLRRVEEEEVALMEIKRFDHETKVKARSERQNLQTALQLCTKQVGTGEINQIIESLLKGKCPKNNQNILNRSLRREEIVFSIHLRELSL